MPHAVGRRKQGEITWTVPSLTSDYRAGLCTTLGLGKNILHGFDVKNATAQVVVEGKPVGEAIMLKRGTRWAFPSMRTRSITP